MSTDETPDIGDEAIPEDFPAGDRGGEAEIDDDPLGVPDDADADPTEQPGIPSGDEPPDAG